MPQTGCPPAGKSDRTGSDSRSSSHAPAVRGHLALIFSEDRISCTGADGTDGKIPAGLHTAPVAVRCGKTISAADAVILSDFAPAVLHLPILLLLHQVSGPPDPPGPGTCTGPQCQRRAPRQFWGCGQPAETYACTAETKTSAAICPHVLRRLFS